MRRTTIPSALACFTLGACLLATGCGGSQSDDDDSGSGAGDELAQLACEDVVSEVVNLICVVLPVPAWLETLAEKVFGGGQSLIATILWVAAIGPVLEELMFRGLVLHVLLRRYSPWVAIVISSTLFAAIHLNPWQIPGAFGGGLLLGWIVVKTRSLWPSVICHALFNGLHYLWQLLAMDIPGYTSDPPEGALLQPLWLDAFGLGFLVLGLATLAVATRPGGRSRNERPDDRGGRKVEDNSIFRLR